MTVVVRLPDEVATILEDRATERGLTVPQLITQMVLGPSRRQALEALIGCAEVPDDKLFEIHRARQELADELLKDQNALSADFADLSTGSTGPSMGIG